MNLLLLDTGEIDDGGRARLVGRRAKHLRRVLKVTPGQTLRGGVLNGGRVTVTVEQVHDDGSVTVRLESNAARTEANSGAGRSNIELIVALPRPQVLHRVLQFAAAMNVARVDLIGAWRVEKSFFQSPSLHRDKIRRQLRLGAEQGMTTRIPKVAIHPRFRPFLEDLDAPEDVEGMPTPFRLLGDAAGTPIESVFAPVDPAAALQIAIGPEGGFIDREVASFVDLGFRRAHLGPWILRVEAAVVAMLAQVALLDRGTEPAPDRGMR